MEEKKQRGGPRPNSGPRPKKPEERKLPVTFYVKAKHLEKAKEQIQNLVDQINKD